MDNAEPVRLVIWDLDETLWKGTLTEGGITHVPEHYEIIKELARRGILSSICSKNDFDVIKHVLVEQNVWDYFVFPSVDWQSKGSRVAQQVEAVQLRAPAVMFIDDNPGNRGEVAAAVPGIQVSNEKLILSILTDHRFKGKNDVSLSRLQQYKLLEKKQSDRRLTSGDNRDFLRRSNIRVVFDYDIEKNIDRAVELINRTNQLNFTKIRLSENAEEARMQLLAECHSFERYAGLVRVVDNYGDYGYVGFFMLHNALTGSRVIHYCWSCRTLGMLIECYVYNFLRRPWIRVVGDVLSDLNTSEAVDWVKIVDKIDDQVSSRKVLRDVRLLGGCELQPLAHYFLTHSEKLIDDTNFVRKSIFVRKNTSSMTQFVSFKDHAHIRAVAHLGLTETDVTTRALSNLTQYTHVVLSFWADASFPHYRHKTLGFVLPCSLVHAQIFDLTRITEEQVRAHPELFPEKTILDVMSHIEAIRKDFEFLGRLSAEQVFENISAVLNSVPSGVPVYMIQPSIYAFRKGKLQLLPWSETQLELSRTLPMAFPHVKFIAIDCLIGSSEERLEGQDHFDRMVYRRLFEILLDQMKQRVI